MMGVMRGCVTKPRGSASGLGMGEVLIPSKLARSETGRTAVTPDKRSSRARSGPVDSPAAASLTTSARLAVVVEGAAVVVLLFPPSNPSSRPRPEHSVYSAF